MAQTPQKQADPAPASITLKPMREPADSGTGAQLLQDIVDHLERFLVLPDEHCAPVLAAWAIHTHVYQSQRSTPRMILSATQMNAGKTTVMRVMRPICSGPPNRAGVRGAAMASKISAAVIAHRIDKSVMNEYPITLMIDEYDQIWRGPEAFMLTGVVNNGYTPAGMVSKMQGGDEKELSAYAPIMMAGIDNGSLQDTTKSRAIIIMMRPAKRHEWEAIEEYIGWDHDPEGDLLAKRAEQWVTPMAGRLRSVKPKMPDHLINRDREVWTPLVSIADLAGVYWGRKMRAAAMHFTTGKTLEARNPGEQLLQKVLGVFEDHDTDRLPTAVLLDVLRNEGYPDLGHGGLAEMLAGHGVKSCLVPVEDGKRVRGYRKADLDQAWKVLLYG